MDEWLIPWRSRGRSAATLDNLLWRTDNLYVMDNHRLALWCWWQHIVGAPKWDFYHVDRHYDALWQQFNPWSANTTSQHRAELEAFRSARIAMPGGGPTALYRWDTVTSAMLALHPDQISDIVFATNEEGDAPDAPTKQCLRPWQLLGYLRWRADPQEEHRRPAIVDIDIDYFSSYDSRTATFDRLFSDEFVTEVGKCLARGLQTGTFGVVTIALSPETTGSWDLAEHILARLLEPVGVISRFMTAAPI